MTAQPGPVRYDARSLQPVLAGAAPRAGMLTFKAMFGGIMGYADGRPFASLSDMGIALKLDRAGREELLAVVGARPLQYEADGPVSKSYVTVPPAMHDDMPALRDWVGRSMAFVLAAAPKPPRRR